MLSSKIAESDLIGKVSSLTVNCLLWWCNLIFNQSHFIIILIHFKVTLFPRMIRKTPCTTKMWINDLRCFWSDNLLCCTEALIFICALATNHIEKVESCRRHSYCQTIRYLLEALTIEVELIRNESVCSMWPRVKRQGSPPPQSQFIASHTSRAHRPVLVIAYYRVIYPLLSYRLALWGSFTNSYFSRPFIMQKHAVRTIA